jgi:hypothetical protein
MAANEAGAAGKEVVHQYAKGKQSEEEATLEGIQKGIQKRW